MATKQQKTGAAVAAVIGVGALGLGAVALMRSNNSTQKEADSMFSGMLGGGATGGYSDTTGVPSNGGGSIPSSGGGSNIGETIGGVLTEVLQTTPQTQPAPIIINPPSNGYEDIIPLINNLDNPSDEGSDIKQEGTFEDFVSISQKYSGTPEYLSRLSAAGFNLTPRSDGKSTAEVLLSQSIDAQSNTAVEYSPFSFTPTPKQQDISSYNVGKTGGATANTPAKNTNTGKSESKPTISGTQTTTQKGTSYSVAESNPVQSALKATSSFVGGIASNVGNFLGGLFGGR